jgi:hypothetical protein
MVQQSDGSGGLTSPFLIAGGNYYLNTTPLNEITLANGNLNMNNHQITNVVDPVLN